jgi:hypothetical protein
MLWFFFQNSTLFQVSEPGWWSPLNGWLTETILLWSVDRLATLSYLACIPALLCLIQQVYVQGYEDLILLTFGLAYFFHSVWSPDCVMSGDGKLIIIFLSQVGHPTISKIMDCPSLAHNCHKPRLACSVYAKVTYVLKPFILGSWWSDWILEVWKQQVLVGRGRISFYSLLCLSELVSESCLLFCNWLRYGLTLSSFVLFEVSCLPLSL